jgi:hypothetical protein
MLKESLLKRALYSGLTTIAILSASGCRIVAETTPKLLDNIDDIDLAEIYKNYFPNNRPELSYRFETKRTKTKLFLNPKIKNRENLEYEINVGLELLY